MEEYPQLLAIGSQLWPRVYPDTTRVPATFAPRWNERQACIWIAHPHATSVGLRMRWSAVLPCVNPAPSRDCQANINRLTRLLWCEAVASLMLACPLAVMADIILPALHRPEPVKLGEHQVGRWDGVAYLPLLAAAKLYRPSRPRLIRTSRCRPRVRRVVDTVGPVRQPRLLVRFPYVCPEPVLVNQ